MNVLKVTVFHNVQHECRRCGKPVVSLGDDEWAHLAEDAGHAPASVSRTGSGYRAGDAMSRVLEARLPGVPSLSWMLEQLFAAFNEPGAAPELAGLARAYRGRRLRSLSVGDVVEIDGARFACAPASWTELPASALFRMVPSREPGSASLPCCSYCGVTGGDSALEPFNLAGSLACRDVRACSVRQGAQEGPDA